MIKSYILSNHAKIRDMQVVDIPSAPVDSGDSMGIIKVVCSSCDSIEDAHDVDENGECFCCQAESYRPY